MPEIGEVARIVHYLRKHLVGKTIAKVTAADDSSVYGKVGTTGAEFQKALTGKKVIEAGQQGKYFWLIMSSPPHPVMHFGMTGWLKIKSEEAYYYKPSKKEELEEWPPKYWKFYMETKEEPKVEAAFVDSRRFARIRLVNCAADQMRKTTPLVENGPDPVVDKDLVTVEWLSGKCRAKKIPIKALLLDQANISGIGNWVGDEILFNAKIHPEQYSNTLSDEQFKQLHKSIHLICDTAVRLLADSEQFPEEWLFKHRWDKGKKEASKTLPTGEKMVWLTVGGRSSAVVPSIQKKTGPVAKEISDVERGADEEEPKKAKNVPSKKRKSEVIGEEEEGSAAMNGGGPMVNGSAKKNRPKQTRKSKFKEELSEEDESTGVPVAVTGGKRKSDINRAHQSATRPSVKRKKTDETTPEAAFHRRRSGRSGRK